MNADASDPGAELIGAAEASHILGVTTMYVRQLCQPAERTEGGHRRYRRADVEALALRRARERADAAAAELAATEARIAASVAA